MALKNPRPRKLSRGKTIAAVLAGTAVAAGVAGTLGQAANAAVIHEVIIGVHDGESQSVKWQRAWDDCVALDKQVGGTTHSTRFKEVYDPFIEPGMWSELWVCDSEG